MSILFVFIYSLLLSTNCLQEFTFLGVTEPSTIWIIQDVGGECYFSKLTQIVVEDSLVYSVVSNFKEFKKTKQFENSFSVLAQVPFIKLTHNNNRFVYQGGKEFIVAEPKVDSALISQFPNDPSKAAEPWNRQMGIRGIQLPQISGVNTTLLYAYHRGLYIKYKVDKVFFIPSKQLLIVFTNQSLLADGGDTMHGFLIFRISN